MKSERLSIMSRYEMMSFLLINYEFTNPEQLKLVKLVDD